MNISIYGHNIKITEDITDYINKKLSKLDRYLPNITEIRVELAKQSTHRGADLAIAQITLRHSRGAILRSEEKLSIENHETVKAAVNGAVDKMYRRINRFKGKRKDKRVRERFMATIEELDMSEDLPEMDEIAVDEEALAEEIVRRKEVSLTSMTEEEAIEQMELLGHAFFMFHNTSTGSVNVLYKRASGGYGVLVPQMQ